MSRIVIDARESGTTTGRYVDKLVEHLHALEPAHDIIVLTKPHRRNYLKQVAPGFTIKPTKFKEFTLEEQTGFKKQIEKLHPDLVHFGMVQQPVLYRGKTVTTMHDLTTARFRNPDKNPAIFWAKQQVYKWVNKKAARKSTFVITPTQYVRNDVINYTHVNPGRVVVTLEAADPIQEAPAPVPGVEGKQFIMYVGRPTPHKNLGRLIEAFAVIQKSHPDLYLVLVGKTDANYQRHEAKVKTEGIPNIIFAGFVPDAGLRWLYEHTRAYVFPSLSEGFGLPGLEAQIHGAPVVCSNATCLPEVYGNSVSYFDPKDVRQMAAKIAEVVDDPILRDDLRDKGRANAAQYSWQRMAQQTLDVYEQALSGR